MWQTVPMEWFLECWVGTDEAVTPGTPSWETTTTLIATQDIIYKNLPWNCTEGGSQQPSSTASTKVWVIFLCVYVCSFQGSCPESAHDLGKGIPSTSYRHHWPAPHSPYITPLVVTSATKYPNAFSGHHAKEHQQTICCPLYRTLSYHMNVAYYRWHTMIVGHCWQYLVGGCKPPWKY